MLVKMWKKRIPVSESVNWYGYYRKWYEGSSKHKKKIELPYDTVIPLLGISEENTNSKKFLHLYVPCSITYNSQYMEAVCTHQ